MLKKFSKITVLLLTASMVSGLFIGCGKAKPTVAVVKTDVNFWYLWGGAEGKRVESIISDYNKSQKKYNVKGLYVADMQKVKVAIAGGSGPDLTDDFNGNIASYADEGIVEPLDSYIKRDKIDFKDSLTGVMDTCKYNNKTYAMPGGVTFFMLFYNKKLLAKAGFTAPPKTNTELLNMAIKTTEVNKDKSINVLGFPDFPFVYYHSNLIASFGGKLYSPDGKFTPDTPESISALNLLRNYRTKFGVDNVLKFDQSGKYTQATDPFMTGNQVFRIDGQWLPGIIRNDLKITKDQLDFGICPLPTLDGQTATQPIAEASSSIFYITANGKNKEGAWDFLKSAVISGVWDEKMGTLPIKKSLLDNKVYADIPNFKDFADFAKQATFVSAPANAKMVEINKMFGDEAELAVTMKKTAEEAMKEAATKGNTILGK
ncbi:MAG TPA: ABC transporter substrate-binding protein [Clostridiaceae bacterium]